MKYAVVMLDGVYRETGNQVQGLEGISTEKEFRFDHFFEQISRIIGRKSIKKVLVIRGPEFTAVPFGACEAVHQLLKQLSDAGREVWYYADEYEMHDCYLSSACSRRIMHPLGTCSFRGLARTGVFFQEALKRREITVEVIRRGKYKSAASPFTGRAFDDADREQLQRLLDETVGFMAKAVMQRSGMEQSGIDRLLAGTICSAEYARELGLIDEGRTTEQLFAEWKGRKEKRIKLKKPKGTWGTGRKTVAVLVHEGAIAPGTKNRKSSLIGQVIGDGFMVNEIRRLRENRRVKAVVFRINSGGGSVTASENILQALKLLAEKKPLIVSMGPVAGSGGYWIATAASKLYCQATAVTGSIGAVTLFFDIHKALESWGITADTVRRGESADLGSALRPLKEEERRQADGNIEQVYQEFIRRVAEFRNREPSEIAELAQGRLWIGSDAAARGLVDETGGLPDALAAAKAAAGLKRCRISCFPRIKKSMVERMLTPKPSGEHVELMLMHQLVRECAALHAESQLIDERLITLGRLY